MAQDYKSNVFTPAKQILVFPDHYLCTPVLLLKDSTLAEVVGDRKIVKAGTIYPANDETAEGIIFTDQDVTDGDKNVALLIHGFVKLAQIPEEPVADAKAAMVGVYFR